MSFSWTTSSDASAQIAWLSESNISYSSKNLEYRSRCSEYPRCDWGPRLCNGNHSYSRPPSDEVRVEQSVKESGIEVEQSMMIDKRFKRAARKPAMRSQVPETSNPPSKKKIEVIILSDDESEEI